MKIFVNGTEVISELHIMVENLSIALSMNQVNSVHFNVTNAFVLTSRTFSDEIKKTFLLGSTLKVALGYGSDTTDLFYGYISELNLDFSEAPVISITALDVRRLMMDSIHQNHVYRVTSYSEALKGVMKNYQSFYENIEIEETQDNLTQITQKGTDYQFVQEQLCAEANKEFLVLGGTVYFRTPEKKKETILTLEWGEGLMTFQERKTQCNQTIRVYGKADDKRDSCMVEVKAYTAGSSTDFMVIKEFQKPNLIGEAKIRQYANNLAGRHKSSNAGGSGSCIGLPELIPGAYIKLGNLDSAEPKEYYISSVKHSFGSGGYTTQFDVEGARI